MTQVLPTITPEASTTPVAWSPREVPRVLSVAGSDPSGGAGIQADLKSIAAAGGYGMAAVTALTAQNTRGVTAVHVPPPEFLTQQLDTLRADVAIDAVKIGMLGTAGVAARVATWLAGWAAPGAACGSAPPPVVLDPVMVATSGDRLLDAAGESAVRDLLDHAHVVTPNVPELAVLLGEPEATGWSSVVDQATRLAARHDVLVVAKGGHLDDDPVLDGLVGPAGPIAEVAAGRVRTSSTHGTGCSLSSGLVTRYAASGDWCGALRRTKQWLASAIAAGEALDVGRGHGPVDHFATSRVPAGHRGLGSRVPTAR